MPLDTAGDTTGTCSKMHGFVYKMVSGTGNSGVKALYGFLTSIYNTMGGKETPDGETVTMFLNYLAEAGEQHIWPYLNYFLEHNVAQAIAYYTMKNSKTDVSDAETYAAASFLAFVTKVASTLKAPAKVADTATA